MDINNLIVWRIFRWYDSADPKHKIDFIMWVVFAPQVMFSVLAFVSWWFLIPGLLWLAFWILAKIVYLNKWLNKPTDVSVTDKGVLFDSENSLGIGCSHKKTRWVQSPYEMLDDNTIEVCEDCGFSRSTWEQGESSWMDVPEARLWKPSGKTVAQT